MGGPNTIRANISYSDGSGSSTKTKDQGNQSQTDDNSTTSLIVLETEPMTLPELKITASDCIATLSWYFDSKEKPDSFEVQYSKDNYQYSKIGVVPILKSSGGPYKYTYNQGTGQGYYCLKVDDKKGTVSYTKVVSIETKCSPKKGF